MSAKARSRFVLISILALCISPVLLAQWFWVSGDVKGGESYGQLLAQPVVAADQQWRLVAHDAAGCSDLATQLMKSAQQLQIAQGRERGRIRSVAACAMPLPTHFASGLYLIDPHGNAVIFYPPTLLQDVAGRQKTIQEIATILKNNRGLSLSTKV
ncbi:hypothetical protein [Deefgea piscis]|uniref:hypothetical protein n=1 Tax=Deefgea piscis TaxID=2739061 RepID=UPI001C7EA224|nr:hypothetical protein [Deefgea piscis]QZA81229.1 hypothetical protein K4H25_00675 [Deefgea piscis]